MKRSTKILIAIFVLLVMPLAAFAEDSLNVQLFRPSIFGGNFIAIEDANTLCPLGLGGGLWFNYANGLLEMRVDNDPESRVNNQLLTTDVLFAFGPTSWLSLGVDVPIHLYSRGRTVAEEGEDVDAGDLASDTTLGDIRAEIKFRLLRQEKHWLGMALAPYGTFPTGDDTQFLGEGRITGGGILALEHDFKALNLALNGGYLYRGDADLGDVNLGDAWRAGVGISRDFGPISFSVEYQGYWYDSGNEEKLKGNPMELFGAFRYKFGKNGPRVAAGGSGGLTSGVGSPAYRMFAGVDYYHCWPEPTQGFLAVLVVDQTDKPLAAKLSIDGAQSMTPGTDTGGNYKSKVEAGDYTVDATASGYEPASGKLTVILGETAVVKLVLNEIPTSLTVIVTEKFTGKKIDAHAIFGTDQSLEISKGETTTAFKAGSYKMNVSAKGYEDKSTDVTVVQYEKNVVNVVLRKKIEKIGKIYFAYDSDVIRKKSYPVLDNVVAQLGNLGQYEMIDIEGHCSSEGTDLYNMNLSLRRATSVKNYLIEKGIDGSKLKVMPFGESKPISSNDTEAGREKNRRVEFIIEE